ncbi:hypothetical protein COV82_02310 [Candidatus Peregrinibacteria bacterium CG11_big_fil_rev_8_21_14_0_20_46_8]|nr:MAG: hypothetical protein COV82_02310 [Candidatus Peregrinibacteria bacterium CG11_big_fil_rev_8_21_14_0_20_46_8]
MATGDKLAILREMLDAAESSLRSARQIVNELAPSGNAHRAYAKQAANLEQTMPHDGEEQIIEGVFDGQNMIGPDGKSYPVPANYASKSKLIPGDVLKLTIGADGAFIYKQIGPIERKRIIGPLIYEDGQYKVLAEGKAYKVLLASVTYYKAEIGDSVTIIVPSLEESDWGAIDNVLPKSEINT